MLNFLGVSTQFACCALQAFADRNKQKPFVIEVNGHLIADITIKYYRKYIDAFRPLITNVKIVGSAHISHANWVFNLMAALPNVQELEIRNLGYNTNIHSFLTAVMRSWKHLSLQNFTMCRNNWYDVHLPQMNDLSMRAIGNIVPSSFCAFLESNPTIHTFNSTHMPLNDRCIRALAQVESLNLDSPSDFRVRILNRCVT